MKLCGYQQLDNTAMVGGLVDVDCMKENIEIEGKATKRHYVTNNMRM